MNFNRTFISAGLIGLSLLLAGSAQAAIITFNFADPGADVPSSEPTVCDGSGQDLCETIMTFTESGLTVTASASDFISPIDPRHVIQDLNPDDGGLGVVNSFSVGSHTGNDNVSGGDILRLDFSTSILLSTVRFSDDHEFSFPSGSDFLFSTDGIAFASIGLAETIGFGVTGTSFFFKHAGQDKDDFYISGLVVETQQEAPEPGTLLLLGAGLVGLAGFSRRRAR